MWAVSQYADNRVSGPNCGELKTKATEQIVGVVAYDFGWFDHAAS